MPLRARGLSWLWWNRNENRLRAGWRVLLAPITFFLSLLIILVALNLLLPPKLTTIVDPLAFLGAVIIFVIIIVPMLDNRSGDSLGLEIDRRWVMDAFVGIGLGLLVPIVTMTAYLSLGWATVDIVTSDPIRDTFLLVSIGLLILVPMSVGEEIFFRGYLYTNILEGTISWLPNKIAVGVASLSTITAFTLAHNAIFDGWASIGYYVIAGLVFLTAVLVTGSLGMAIGMHAAYNIAWFLLDPLDINSRLLTLQFHGPSSWAGSHGLLETFTILLVIIPILVWAQYRTGSIRLHLLRPIE